LCGLNGDYSVIYGRIKFTENTPINMNIGIIFQIFWNQMLDISFLPIVMPYYDVNMMVSSYIPENGLGTIYA
jgi:hypothetical protein